jgi:hypothetical protein
MLGKQWNLSALALSFLIVAVERAWGGTVILQS